MKKVIFTKNHKDGNRYRIKNQILDCLPWKAKELIELKVAKLLYKDESIETAMIEEKKETR